MTTVICKDEDRDNNTCLVKRKQPSLTSYFPRGMRKKKPMQGESYEPLLSSARGSTSVVALSLHEEMLPLEDEGRMSG